MTDPRPADAASSIDMGGDAARADAARAEAGGAKAGRADAARPEVTSGETTRTEAARPTLPHGDPRPTPQAGTGERDVAPAPRTGVEAAERPDPARIRDAATVILIDREAPGGPSVLMGMRGAAAAFMPSKYVFPGGAVDPEDGDTPSTALAPLCRARLAAEPRDGSAVTPDALANAALRELAEETGLTLDPTATAPLSFVFRAITPPGRPRRFDARFFVIDAAHIAGDRHDFGAACDELSHLHWVPLAEARALDLPFITEVVLAEIAAMVADGGPLAPATVPFFDNRADETRFVQLP